MSHKIITRNRKAKVVVGMCLFSFEIERKKYACQKLGSKFKLFERDGGRLFEICRTKIVK